MRQRTPSLLAQCLGCFGILARGRVFNHRDVVEWIAILVTKQGDSEISPETAAVLAGVAFLQGIGSSTPADEIRRICEIFGEIVRMREFLEVRLQQFGFGITEHRAEAPVHTKPPTVEADMSHAHCDLVKGLAEVRFALFQLALKTTSFRHVVGNTNKQARAGKTTPRRQSSLLAIKSTNSELGPVRRPAFDCVRE